jgi:hypothetical protein
MSQVIVLEMKQDRSLIAQVAQRDDPLRPVMYVQKIEPSEPWH